jgi:hypothetical protein
MSTKCDPRGDKRGFDLISDGLSFGRLWYGEPDAINNAISQSHPAIIRVFDESDAMIERREHTGDFKEP